MIPVRLPLVIVLLILVPSSCIAQTTWGTTVGPIRDAIANDQYGVPFPGPLQGGSITAVRVVFVSQEPTNFSDIRVLPPTFTAPVEIAVARFIGTQVFIVPELLTTVTVASNVTYILPQPVHFKPGDMFGIRGLLNDSDWKFIALVDPITFLSAANPGFNITQPLFQAQYYTPAVEFQITLVPTFCPTNTLPCGHHCYSPQQHICENQQTSFLCPVNQPSRCRTGCYDPAIYQCLNGILTLRQISANPTSPPSPSLCGGTDLTCGIRCYSAQTHVCTNPALNLLCPINQPNACGLACYNVQDYGCVNGQLVSLP